LSSHDSRTGNDFINTEEEEQNMLDKMREYFKRAQFRIPAFAAVALVFLVAGLLMASSFKFTGQSQALAPSSQGRYGVPMSFADLAQDLGPTVVNIKVTKIQTTGFSGTPSMPEGPFGDLFKHFFGDMQRLPEEFKTQGAGSGVIIGTDGQILTNNHVVEGSKEIIVTMNDKREFKARIIGRDQKTDLAVIKVNAVLPFKAATLGDSDKLRVGEWVIAIGNPFGLTNTVTSGIVSAKGRVIGAGPYDDFIQTDAPINPGNSGGPLFNMKGEVVGINTAIIPNGQGIGFAIPVSTAKSLIPQLIQKGKVTRGYLGIQIQDISPDLAAALNIKEHKGALVSDVVHGGPAEIGGIKRGDVVVSFNGKEIENSHELPSIVAATPVNTEVPIRIIREGKELSLQVKIEKLQPDETEETSLEKNANSQWGLKLQDLNPAIARQLGFKGSKGVLVADVQTGSPAEAASIQKGDIIVELNRETVKDAKDLNNKLEKFKSKGPLLFLVFRNGGNLYIAMNS
jgi:serine protease Do